MPADPSKAGYTFKEWNTAIDGTGTKFTGSTVVNEDMTVYAIYTKTNVPSNGNKPNKPNRPTKPANPNTGDSASLPPYIMLMGLATGLTISVRMRNKIKES